MGMTTGYGARLHHTLNVKIHEPVNAMIKTKLYPIYENVSML